MVKKKLQKSFIKLLFIFVIAILLSGVLLFQSTMQLVFLNQVNQANAHLVEQIKSSFELVLEQLIDKANKLGIYDNKLVQLLNDRRDTVLNEMELYTMLNSIVLENQYLHSAYLYSEEEELIFDSKSGCRYSVSDFYDTYVIQALKEKYFAKVNPHLIRNINGNPDLIYSIIVQLPMNIRGRGASVLSLNVDMNKLYKDIMKRSSLKSEVALFIYDQKNQIIVSQSAEDISDEIKKNVTIEAGNASISSVFFNKSGVMDAAGYSKLLDWNFYLQVPFTIDITNMVNKYVTILFIITIVTLFLVIIFVVIRHTTKPLDAFLNNYNEKVLKDLLTESNYINEKNYMEMDTIKKSFPFQGYMVLLIESDGSSDELFQLVSSCIMSRTASFTNILLKTVNYPNKRAAVVCNLNHIGQITVIEQDVIKQLYQRLSDTYAKKVYISISTYKQGYGELWTAAKECEEILDYKLSITKNIMSYHEFADMKGEITYPLQFEKQIINNLLAANYENCIFYMDKFMEHLFHNERIISDMSIKNYFYQLQVELLKHTSSLPISIKTTDRMDLKYLSDKDYLYENIIASIHNICTEMNKKDNFNESILIQSILDYIQNNIADDNFNLNTLSYQFNMNRNYLARLLKENTNYSFNDYVNFKKVEMSKELLKDKYLTIEQISSKVGFRYSHYFIKVFKSIEGVTPGAYRKMLTNNNYAPIQ